MAALSIELSEEIRSRLAARAAESGYQSIEACAAVKAPVANHAD